MRRMQAAVTALLVGGAVAVVVLAAEVLLGARIGPPLWTCVSSAPATATRVPPPTGDPSTATFEELVSHSDCTDRVGVPLALVAFVTGTVMAYRRASRQ